MQLSSILSIFSVAAAASAQSAVSVSYDTGYDDAGRSLNVVSCSDGTNGLETRYGWTVQGQIPKFPYVGGADVIPGYNSPNCGTCWQLSYNGRSINVLAIDHTATGFNIAQAALNDLTNGQAVALGRITATATQVDVSQCGL